MTATIFRQAGKLLKFLSATTMVLAVVIVDGGPARAPHSDRRSACVENEPAMHGVLILSRQDIIDIKKVATTEVVGSLKGKAFEDQVRGVVDTVLNRTQSRHWGNLRSVVNAKGQFSAIAGPRYLKPYGSVEKMSARAISPKVAADVDQWLQMRANGAPSSVADNLSYLNPLYSSKSSLHGWGWSVVRQAKKSGYVMGAGKATHYHGTSADLMKYKPDSFSVVLSD
ncbi:cell wall hydrolase [Rhizobium sullae]|uniref:Cell wall hydrolase n=1 Tax=Rhizobium sullae TaxID=50338 RepID=A0A4R3PYH1_RHISU|nr:cell wall hydrolase [Rhizobium sullae]TCU13738.1 cell wall hydrolase [Rhizobium sullae]